MNEIKTLKSGSSIFPWCSVCLCGWWMQRRGDKEGREVEAGKQRAEKRGEKKMGMVGKKERTTKQGGEVQETKRQRGRRGRLGE